jgi:hypothetical protein
MAGGKSMRLASGEAARQALLLHCNEGWPFLFGSKDEMGTKMPKLVIPGLIPGIHVLTSHWQELRLPTDRTSAAQLCTEETADCASAMTRAGNNRDN